MGQKKQIVKQWLETEAAFGVSDVPVTAKRAGKKGAGGAGKSVESKGAAAPRVSAPVARVATPQAGGSAGLESGVAPVRAAPVGRGVVKAGTVEIPGPPAGDIGELPVLSRAGKETALAALLAETTAELGKYLDEVATKVVFGEGDVDAPVMFVGEGPGIEEDRLGRPFVGKSGQLLDKQIAAMGYTREKVFIANVVKLRAASPSEEWGGRLKDRPPTPEEVARNIGFLYKQIEIIRPKVIVTLGAPALKYVTASKEGITKIRGTWLSFRGIPVMPTFHPAYILRNYTDETRRKVWEDLKAVVAKVKK